MRLPGHRFVSLVGVLVCCSLKYCAAQGYVGLSTLSSLRFVLALSVLASLVLSYSSAIQRLGEIVLLPFIHIHALLSSRQPNPSIKFVTALRPPRDALKRAPYLIR